MAPFTTTTNDPNQGFKVMVLLKGEYFKTVQDRAIVTLTL